MLNRTLSDKRSARCSRQHLDDEGDEEAPFALHRRVCSRGGKWLSRAWMSGWAETLPIASTSRWVAPGSSWPSATGTPSLATTKNPFPLSLDARGFHSFYDALDLGEILRVDFKEGP